MGIKFNDFEINGIDISEYNDLIDWSKVSGTDFCAVRVGHGRVTDLRFVRNWSAAKGRSHRLPYWYMDYYSNHMSDTTAYGISDVDWGRIQAEKYWELVKNDPSGIVFLDIEKASIGPELNTVKDRVLTVARAFLERADALSGKYNGMYLSLSMISFFTDWFKDRPLWVAWYTDSQTPTSVLAAVKAKGWKGKCLIWQYASDGDMDDDGSGDGKTLGMPYPWLDLNGWIATDDDWKAFTGGQMTDILLNIEPLSQRDRRWFDDQLGTSVSTIGGYGCLITDATMLLRYLLGIGITPAELNTWLKANGGYQNYNLFLWSVLKKYDPRISFGYRYNYAALDKIDEQLETGMPVIVNVDMNGEHWVFIVGKVGGSYIINDPWYGLQLKFEKNYGDPRTGVKVVCTYNFTGEIAAPPDDNEEGDENMIELYKVKVLIPDLLIRGGPGSIYPVVQRYATGTLSVYEEKNGYGKIGEGRWISLNPAYVQKITIVPGEVTDPEKLVRLWNAHPELH